MPSSYANFYYIYWSNALPYSHFLWSIKSINFYLNFFIFFYKKYVRRIREIRIESDSPARCTLAPLANNAKGKNRERNKNKGRTLTSLTKSRMHPFANGSLRFYFWGDFFRPPYPYFYILANKEFTRGSINRTTCLPFNNFPALCHPVPQRGIRCFLCFRCLTICTLDSDSLRQAQRKLGRNDKNRHMSLHITYKPWQFTLLCCKIYLDIFRFCLRAR